MAAAANVRLVGVVLDPEADRARILSSLRQAGAGEATFTLADTLAALLPRTAPPDIPSRLDGAERPQDLPSASAVPVGTA